MFFSECVCVFMRLCLHQPHRNCVCAHAALFFAGVFADLKFAILWVVCYKSPEALAWQSSTGCIGQPAGAYHAAENRPRARGQRRTDCARWFFLFGRVYMMVRYKEPCIDARRDHIPTHLRASASAVASFTNLPHALCAQHVINTAPQRPLKA